MMTLLVLACVIGGGDESCHVAVVAGGMINERQCSAYKRLMVEGWKGLHPNMDVRREICTTTPEFIIGAWKA